MSEITEEERQRLIKAAQNGIRFAPGMEEALGRINHAKPDFTVTDAKITTFWGPWERNEGGMEISWATESAGFGQLVLSLTKDGKLKAYTENMGKEFCKQVLAKLMDGCEID